MATQKKPQSKSTKTTKTTPAKKSKKAPAKKTPAKASPNNRKFQGIFYILLSIISVFSLMNFDGFLLGAFHTATTFCIGFGVFILPLSLIFMSVLCFTGFKGDPTLRAVSILSFPILMPCFLQLLLFNNDYKLNFENISLLTSKGLELESAGLLGGFISIILEASLSTVGALFLLFVINCIFLFIAFNVTPFALYQTIKSYFDSLAYDENLAEVEYKLSEKEKKKAQKEKRKEVLKQQKIAKQEAFEEYKSQVEVPIKTSSKPFKIDIPLHTESKPAPEPMPLNEDIDSTIDYSKELKNNAWISQTHQQIKERELESKLNSYDFDARQQKFKEKELIAEKLVHDPIIPVFLEDTMPIPDIPIPDIPKTLKPSPDSIDYIMEDLSEIQLIKSPYLNEAELLKDISFNVDSILNEKKENAENSQPFNVDFDDLYKAIDETLDDGTKNYSYAKNPIVFDELKSTLKYEISSDFDPETLEYKYVFPPISLLNPKIAQNEVDPTIELRQSSKNLIETLSSFGISCQIINIVRGPSVSRFEITISKGVKISKIEGLSADIALALGATSVRIAPIPEKIAIGIEVPNKTTDIVLIREVLESPEFINTQSKLAYSLGKDITDCPAIGDIAKMPHILVAGTTGSGKSVCVNAMLISILYKADPDEVKFIMIDPKMVELNSYNGIPHLLVPVVTEPSKATGALNWAVSEMERRYKLFTECNVKELTAYNIYMEKLRSNGDLDAVNLPQIVIVIDELADLMMVASKEIEESICRIAQKARAAGMHLVIATQRPSADVITGLMKSNIPSRIAFAVSSSSDSRIILDQNGADKLIGKGDMLYNPIGAPKPIRLQGCFITATEVENVVEHIKKVSKPNYNEDVMSHIENHSTKDSQNASSDSMSSSEFDPMTEDAIDVLVSTGQCTTSLLQRKLKLGFPRASRIMDEIEERGIVSPPDSSKNRQLLITKQQWQEMKLRNMD